MDDRALSELRDLERRDSELSDRAAELRRLDDEVASIRSAAQAVGAFVAGLPEEEARRSAELGAAAIELGERRAQLAHAEQEIARAGADAEARDAAERARARAADHVAVAQARVDRAEAAVSDLRRDAEQVPAQLPVLLERATRVESSTPPIDVSSLVEWASHAHAELFVAVRQLDAQRERVIREANELASMLIGEATYGATVTQALARAEAHWVSAPGQVSDRR